MSTILIGISTYTLVRFSNYEKDENLQLFRIFLNPDISIKVIF